MRRIFAVLMIAVAMIGVGASQANAAGGGRYSYNHQDSRYTVNFRQNALPALWGPGGLSDPVPAKEQWTPPGRNAAGLAVVSRVWSPKPGYMQCDNDRYRKTIYANQWNHVCPGDQRMVVVIK